MKSKSLKSKRTEFNARDWVPMMTALERIRERTGSTMLAANDLDSALRDGTLSSACRRVDRAGRIHQSKLSPSSWEQLEFIVTDNDWVRIFVPKNEKAWPSGEELHFFVQRADLDNLYPPFGSADHSSGITPTVVTTPPTRRPGPVTKYDWHTIAGEIARRCHDKAGHLRVPDNQSKLAEQVHVWCQEQYDHAPAFSELKEAVRRVCARLAGYQ